MMDDQTWLRAVRRVSRGPRRNGFEIDNSSLYNPNTGRFRRNPIATGVLLEAPVGSGHQVDVKTVDGQFELESQDADYAIKIGMQPGDEVSVTFDPNGRVAFLNRTTTLRMNGVCGGCLEQTGSCLCASEIRSNPQLQVLGDYTRRNPGTFKTDLMGPDTAKAIRKFHGKVSGSLLSEHTSDDGNDGQVFDLAYLGHSPAVSWLSTEPGSAKKQIDVNGELVRFNGFRNLFRGQSRPILALNTPNNEACVVQGTVESLNDRCDSRGVLGFSPVVEYIAEGVKNGIKGKYHYVHEFEKDFEPVLRIDKSLGGFVFDRDRTLVGSRRNKKEDGFNPTAIYEVDEWFEEKGVRRHGERSQ